MRITKKHIPGVVRNRYVGGEPTTIVLHETANQMSTIDNESDFVNRNWQNAFFHYLVTDNAIYEKADPRYLAWGAGPQINPYAIHIELVRNNGKNFNKAYDNYIWLTRKLASDFGIPTIFNKQRNGIVTHRWVTNNLGGTTHVDPDAWLAQNGVSMSKLESDLKSGINKKETFNMTRELVNVYFRLYLAKKPAESDYKFYVGMNPSEALKQVKASAAYGRVKREVREGKLKAHEFMPQELQDLHSPLSESEAVKRLNQVREIVK